MWRLGVRTVTRFTECSQLFGRAILADAVAHVFDDIEVARRGFCAVEQTAAPRAYPDELVKNNGGEGHRRVRVCQASREPNTPCASSNNSSNHRRHVANPQPITC